MQKSKGADSDRRMMEKLIQAMPEEAETLRENFARIETDKAAGLIIDAPRTYKDCRSWREAWAYIFRRGWREEGHSLRLEGGKVTCAIWKGVEFSDKLVGPLEKIAGLIGINNDLVEMRLIGTRVTSKGVEKLKKILPKAVISICSRDEAKKNPSINYTD